VDMWSCTSMTIYDGTRADIGSTLQPVHPSADNWGKRMIFDLTYFVVITTVLMNVIFGIIIDTFGALRDEHQHREDYMKNTTFISSIGRSEVNKAAFTAGISNGFDKLVDERQHVWNYLNFVFYLKRKDESDYVGLETTIAKLIANEDPSWLPIATCKVYQIGSSPVGVPLDSAGIVDDAPPEPVA